MQFYEILYGILYGMCVLEGCNSHNYCVSTIVLFLEQFIPHFYSNFF